MNTSCLLFVFALLLSAGPLHAAGANAFRSGGSAAPALILGRTLTAFQAHAALSVDGVPSSLPFTSVAGAPGTVASLDAALGIPAGHADEPVRLGATVAGGPVDPRISAASARAASAARRIAGTLRSGRSN
jgi:hypothetical protein